MPGVVSAFEALSAGSATLAGTDWVHIELRSAHETPWTNGATVLDYSASDNLLQRGPELIRVPDDVALRLDRAEALDAGTRVLPWVLLGALAAAFGLVAALAALVRRRADLGLQL